MALTLLAFALPAALFLVLALLPHGRPALLAALAMAAALIILWGAHYLDVLGLGRHGQGNARIIAFFMLLGLTLAWFMATSLQILRQRFPPHWPGWSWPAVVVVTLLVIGYGLWRMLNV
ncbi:hypothetical protein FIU85_02925 [Roseovarius sp. THAF8]|uniref:hypothetical protein n=1 Tax=Roseovarius sp. THAF8 TaxID=2587846 RepID=UPI001268E2D1|nr:hypothetical protein [Roseovarius sp. THAF8]QFT96245.1 hypothetical protein FIU85_02925 [Roseovarius sp. THAF8]